ncbi:DNA-dependent metalloprotease SPRTN-like, partial [Schistocerca cancellata]|uniref:DNA-dependent metalloprotease SPRTN-like n=1 Tax=Schistocerca cancellata TaxID=274614 RepID=UPI002117E585
MSLSEESHEHESSKDEYEPTNSTPLGESHEEDNERMPDVKAMFSQFNSRFFDSRLNGVEVGWSSRLTSSGGTCTFEGGSCSIRLNEHLLVWRPRKDLVETLLHEMIHAYLFVVDNDQNRQEHTSAFCRHMARINKAAGTNIRPHHDLYEGLDPFRRRWWRCSGPCQKWPPRFGIVTRCRGCPPGP